MKKIDFGQTITILANLGVIAGIVFLGIELRQNNRLLTAQAEYAVLQNRTDIEMERNPELAALWFKVNSGEPLTEVERYRADTWVSGAILNWEWEYSQYLAGDLRELPIASWRAAFHGVGTRRKIDFSPTWNQMIPVLNPQFVSFVEENVIRPGPP